MPVLRTSALLATALAAGMVGRTLGSVGGPVEPRLSLMTFNLAYEDVGREPSLDAIAAADPDIVVLQEVTVSWQKLLGERFAGRYPYMLLLPYGPRRAGGLGVMSRARIEHAELTASPVGWFPAQRLVLATAIGRLQVLNLHLRPAIIDGSWLKGYFTSSPLRRQEIEHYWPTVDPALPTVVAGDFNEDPGQPVDQFITAKGLRRLVTDGPLKSWRWYGDVAGEAIELAMDLDHVLVTPELVGQAHVVDGGSSDHRPVLVQLRRGAGSPAAAALAVGTASPR